MPLPNHNHALQHIDPKTKRPTRLISQGKEIRYDYDRYGNIKHKTTTPIDPTTGQAIQQSSQSIVGYLESLQLFYHPNNELKQSIKITQQGLTLTKTTTEYYYDAFGRRIAKTAKVETLNKVNQHGQLVKYPSNLQQLRKTDKTQHQTTLMLWDGNRQLQEYTHHHIFTTVYDDENFEPVSRIVQSRDKDCDDLKIYHYHNNHLGTPQELTDNDGNIIWANYEWAWGGRYTHHYTSQSLNNCAILEHELQPIRFQGQFFDPETSLHYNRFRYYDSDVGMFIQRDPIGLLGGVNVYQYADNPTFFIDPFGLRSVAGKQDRLRAYINDNKVSKSIRGWLKNEQRRVSNLNKQGKRANIRLPFGYDLAHWRGYESKKGYSYTYTDLNYKSNHRTQHKYDDKGRKNENKVSKKCLGLNEDDIKTSRGLL